MIPKINFLSAYKGAPWIVFPFVVDARAHPKASLDTVFRREFTLDHAASRAALSVRALKRVELKINGAPVELGVTRNWKNISKINVEALLKTGRNVIEARVFSDDSRPALWLILDTDQLTLSTDASWQASFTGSAWRDAVMASKPRLPGVGNQMTAEETTYHALAAVWPIWLAFGAAALGILGTAHWCLHPGNTTPPVSGRLSRRAVFALLFAVASLWGLLFWNNDRLLPFQAGFDWEAHRDYIKYVQEHWKLPLPNEGFEMFQPPLYYVLSAAALSALHLSTASDTAIVVLRTLNLAVAVAQFTLVFLSLRLLFPGHVGGQLVGLLLAAFLPMQLYLSHFTTNEMLAALFATAAIYFALRVLITEDASVSDHLWLGLFLGAAMLTKATAVLLLLPLVLALAGKLVTQAKERKRLRVILQMPRPTDFWPRLTAIRDEYSKRCHISSERLSWHRTIATVISS